VAVPGLEWIISLLGFVPTERRQVSSREQNEESIMCENRKQRRLSVQARGFPTSLDTCNQGSRLTIKSDIIFITLFPFNSCS
jgi:hypothetical protein